MSETALDIATIQGMLRTQRFGRPILHYDTVTSTNDLARQRAEEGATEGTVVCAEDQSAGRGRMARAWTAPAYSSVLMSIIVRPSLQPGQLGRVGMAFGLGLANAVRHETGLNALLKWPNDLMINRDKCAGMLAEAVFADERIAYAVVGIGLNVNWNAASLEGTLVRATSIANELGHSFSRDVLLASILNHSATYYTRVINGASLKKEWSDICATLGNEIQAHTPWGEERGIAEQIDEDGALLVRRADGSIATLSAADVSLHSS